jgi:hypothetical protein
VFALACNKKGNCVSQLRIQLTYVFTLTCKKKGNCASLLRMQLTKMSTRMIPGG